MNDAQTTTQTVSLSQAFGMAQKKHRENDLAGARKIYQRISRLAPDHVDTLVMLASLDYREGRDAQGQASLARAVDLTRAKMQRLPEDMSARAALINFLLAQNRPGEAETLMEELVLPLNPVRSGPAEFSARRKKSIARGLPAMVITTLPKSASESIWNKLAQGLGLAQCYFSLGLFPDCCAIPSRVAQAAKGGVAIKEHIGPTAHNVAVLRGAGIDRLIVHHRDPRQAALSWAHFVRDDVGQRVMGPLWRKIVPPSGIMEAGLDATLDWCIEHYLPLQIRFLSGWQGIAAQADPPLSVLFMSFESFLAEPDAYFSKVLDFYDIPQSSYAAGAKAETVHLRQGQSDEWRQVFSQEQRDRAWEAIPPEMAREFAWSY